MTTTTHTAIEFEACVEFLTDNLEAPLTHYSRTLAHSDERGRQVIVPGSGSADNFKGRLVLRRYDAESDSWVVVTSTDKPRVAALFYFA